ncbi:EF-hand domain-containing protein [Alteromonas sp. M12]|uniref:EF-hand domain-containing protein n=1 Tax=Alteromonas sp. M12 TaxID=3135644 RepID=UPI00319DC989
MKNLLKTVVATAFVTTLFACSTTSTTSNTKQDRFSKVDANSDGRVTVEEFSSSIKKPKNGPKRFGLLDVDKNGYLNRTELEAERKNKKNKKKKKEN